MARIQAITVLMFLMLRTICGQGWPDWHYTVYMELCNYSMVEPAQQQFAYDSTTKLLRALGYNNNYCLFATGKSDPVGTMECNANNANETWTYNSNKQFVSSRNSCLDVYDFKGSTLR